MTSVLALLIPAALAGLILHYGGLGALLYAGLYAAALLPGLPVGRRLFGLGTPLGWTAGALVGYALSALALSIPVWLGVAHPLTFLAAWVVTVVLTRRIAGTGPALVSLPDWTRRDTTRWLLMLALVLALVAVPFARVGETDDAGTRRYRAYFTADFIWHMAMTEELARFEFPPVNPYLAPEPVHYYWTYFMVPAALAGPEDARLLPVEAALKVTATGAALLLFSLVFLAAWSVSGSSGAALAASVLALMAPSWEGLYTLHDLWSRGLPPHAIVDQVRQMNIDAVTNWKFQGLRIDGLVRSMWWTPQHATSFSLGLLALTLAAHAGSAASRAVTGGIGLVLALSVAMNPFLGAAFCAIHGLVVLWPIVRRAASPRTLLDQAWTVTPVAIALGWTILNQMGGGAGSSVFLGWKGLARNAPVATMVLSLGGLFVPAALSVWAWRRSRLDRAWVAVPAAIVSLALAWFVSLTETAWVGFRAGNILQVTLPMLAASGLVTLAARSRRTAVALTSVLLLAGAPTTLIDTFNAQDLENDNMGPGFRWTIPISPAQQAGFRWLRANTPVTSVVQADPVVRGRENWSLVPSYAGRRMAAGDPISLLAAPAYIERSQAVHHLIVAAPPDEAHAIATRLGIDYLWFDDDDDAASADRLQARPQLFRLVFRLGAVRILAVAPASS